MRFGLGPKPGVAKRLCAENGVAFQACMSEVLSPAALIIPDTDVKTYCTDTKGDVELDYEKCCRFGAVFRPPSTGFRPQPSHVLQAERAARYAKSLEPDVGFAERLVHFWSNHFSVFGSKSLMVQATAGHLERSVIRPRVLGKFADMLKAVYTHPAMICYLENQYSLGPRSTYATKNPKKKVDINENLAREILELHTLGIDGGYSQTDVTSLAKILTGWTHYPPQHQKAGQFYFEPAYHEPGSQTVLDVTYSQSGIDQGLAVFDALARHPATAQHIAYKLLRHFVTDEPPPALVAYLAQIFRATDGDLQAMAKALISLPQSWTEPLGRLVQPLSWQLSMLRGMGVSRDTILARAVDPKTGLDYYRYEISLTWAITYLGQPIWGCLTPDGFPDEDYYWKNADALRIRKDVAVLVIGSFSDKPPAPPVPLAADLLAGFQSEATAAAIADIAKDNKRAFAMLFVSPEYILR